MTANRLEYQLRRRLRPRSTVASDDIVLVTTGSQAADLSAGTMDEPPPPPHPGRSWALWKTLAEKHKGFGNPDVFFGDARIADFALGDVHGHDDRHRNSSMRSPT